MLVFRINSKKAKPDVCEVKGVQFAAERDSVSLATECHVMPSHQAWRWVFLLA